MKLNSKSGCFSERTPWPRFCIHLLSSFVDGTTLSFQFQTAQWICLKDSSFIYPCYLLPRLVEILGLFPISILQAEAWSVIIFYARGLSCCYEILQYVLHTSSVWQRCHHFSRGDRTYLFRLVHFLRGTNRENSKSEEGGDWILFLSLLHQYPRWSIGTSSKNSASRSKRGR